jgi:hypothetical protein
MISSSFLLNLSRTVWNYFEGGDSSGKLEANSPLIKLDLPFVFPILLWGTDKIGLLSQNVFRNFCGNSYRFDSK